MECARCGEPVEASVPPDHYAVCGRCVAAVRLTQTGVPLWPVPDENDNAGDPPAEEDARAIYLRAVTATPA